jgi:hypothetical protein
MQFQYARATLEIQQRQAAFEALFGRHDDLIGECDRLRGLARKSLGDTAFWAASTAFDEGDVAGCRQLLELALVLDPELPSQPRWARFALKRGMGTWAWRVIRPVADLVRAPFRLARTVTA